MSQERSASGHFVADDTAAFEDYPQFKRAPRTLHEYAAVLIKKDGILGPVYFLNHRPKKEDDKVYQNRIGLFAGKRDVDKEESFEDAAEREMREETGLEMSERELVRILDLHSYDDAGNGNIGRIFLQRYGFLDGAPNSNRIRAHMKREEARIKREEGRDYSFGEVVKIKRWFWTFYTRFGILPINWSRYTPEVMYALVADYDMDIAKRFWRRRRR